MRNTLAPKKKKKKSGGWMLHGGHNSYPHTLSTLLKNADALPALGC